MGCFSSKHAARDASSSVFENPADNNNGSAMILEPYSLKKNQSGNQSRKDGRSTDRSRELNKSKKENSHSHSKGPFSSKLGLSHRYVQAEQTAAGWPTWLSAVAGEAIDGWLPLRADSFEKLEKVCILILFLFNAITSYLSLLIFRFLKDTGDFVLENCVSCKGFHRNKLINSSLSRCPNSFLLFVRLSFSFENSKYGYYIFTFPFIYGG